MQRTGAFKIFLSELVLSSGIDNRLCRSLQIVELHKSICKHVHSFLVTNTLECNTTSIKRTNNNSITDVPVVTNHVKLVRAMITRSLTFISGYSSSEVEKESTSSLPYNIKPSDLLSIFILLAKKGSNKGSTNSCRDNLRSPTLRSAKLSSIQRWLQ